VILNQKTNSILSKISTAFESGLGQSGPLLMAPSPLGLLAKSDPMRATPNLEWHIQPLFANKLGNPLHRFAAITALVCNLRPDRRGYIHVQSLDPAQQPKLVLNDLSTQSDLSIAGQGIRMTRKIMAAPTMMKDQPTKIMPGPQTMSATKIYYKRREICHQSSSISVAPVKWAPMI